MKQIAKITSVAILSTLLIVVTSGLILIPAAIIYIGFGPDPYEFN